MSRRDRQSTTRFGPRAQAYAAFRPSYPAEAIAAALEDLGDPETLTVADVGAGTGISSRLFGDRGVRVIAIEPNAQMRATAQPHPRVAWHDASAERTGLGDQSVDVVSVCQAFHWFANDEAMNEFRRVARRRVVLLQYERDERDGFTKAYSDLVNRYATDDTERMRQVGLAAFANFPGAKVTRRDFPSSQRLDREGLLGRAASSSYLPAFGPAAANLKHDLNALFDRYQRDGFVELAMVTHVLLADW